VGPGHTLNSITLCLKEHHSLATGSPPAVPHKPHSFLKAKTHNCYAAVLPHRRHKSSLYFLWGWSNTTPLQPYPHHCVPSGPTVTVYTASLTDMPSSLTTHGSTWQCSKVTKSSHSQLRNHMASSAMPPNDSIIKLAFSRPMLP
jgi:hypothetical protein